MEIERLSNGQAVVDDIRLKCVDALKPFALLGHAPLELCVMEQLARQEILYIHYPGSSVPQKLQTAQSIVFAALEDSVQNIQTWEDTEYGLFWKKEGTLRLRALQYDKMTALRQENREAQLIPQDHSLWAFRPEEVMDESTATILDAHVAQLERELSILIYDIKIWKIRVVGHRCDRCLCYFLKDYRSGNLYTSLSLCFSREPRCSDTNGVGSFGGIHRVIGVFECLYHTDNERVC